MNKKGSALLLILILSVAVLPAAGTLLYIARSDLSSALDDYHHVRAMHAARGGLDLAGADLLKGGDGRVVWPDSSVTLAVSVTETQSGWNITITACSDKATAVASGDYEKNEEENN